MDVSLVNIFPPPYRGRYLIEEKIASILVDSYYLPCNQSVNGAFFIDNYHFAANLKILGQRLGINANSLNKDFRHHKILYVQKLPTNKSTNLFDAKSWKIYHHSNNLFSLENVLKGDKHLTTKWDKNARKFSNNRKEQNDEKIDDKNELNIGEQKKSKESKPVKILYKAQDPKIAGVNDQFSDDDENYIYFLS